jgi:hypothetical protein
LPSSSLSGVCSLIFFPLFATGVNDTGGKFAAGVVDTGGNLPPASLTTAANLPPVSLMTPVTNLPPVSLVPVANLQILDKESENKIFSIQSALFSMNCLFYGPTCTYLALIQCFYPARS